MFITDKEFNEAVARDNPDGCLGLRHYIVNNGTPYAQIEAVFDEQAAKFCGCPFHLGVERYEKMVELFNLTARSYNETIG